MTTRRPSTATVIAVIALFVACGGTAVANGYLITSAGQINPSVRNALRGNRGPRGYRGSTGPQGAAGAQGATGAQGTPGLLGLTEVRGPAMTYQPGTYGAPPPATCPTGDYVVGTGFSGPFSSVGGFVLAYGTFVGGFFANNSPVAVDGNVQAICAQLPPGKTGFTVRRTALVRRDVLTDLRRAIAIAKSQGLKPANP